MYQASVSLSSVSQRRGFLSVKAKWRAGGSMGERPHL